ncbi:MAG TPA: hypothetical protein VJA66_17265 [Thermoanaerobaculia bacterium]
MKSALAAVVILLLSACTANAPHRLTADGKALEAQVHPGDLATEEGRLRIETSALEVHDDFQLAFLEFDDQGNLFSRAPLELLIQTLRREAARPDSPRILLLLFAHGWKNDARLCNRNVCCFRSLLSRLSADVKTVMERSKGTVGSIRTIGIFVGWRGLSATIPPFKELSFYARKRAAQSIGQGELVELLEFLDGFQKNLNERDPRRCRLVILGHSFGGAMVYSAVANVLKSRIVDARVKSVLAGREEPIEGFGDLVVLANPAFEASLYQPIQELMSDFPSFSPRQRPVLVVLSSETDSDTRVFFKLGRSLSTLFQKTGPRSSHTMLVTTVGNYDPFVTHRATLNEMARRDQPASIRATISGCQCDLSMPPLSDESLNRILEIFQAEGGAVAPPPPTLCPGFERMGTVDLTCMVTRPPGLPLWVVRASNDVISGHSGFFTRAVTDIIRSLTAQTVMENLSLRCPA